MAEYFWIQKNDAEGRTIALENRIKVSAESVTSKLHEIASLKESSLAKNQLFALSKLLGKANRLPLAPLESKKAPIEAAMPTQMVETSHLIYCMVS